MLSTPLVRTRPRAGLTLAEMLVALTIAGVILALISAIALRQQRLFADLSGATSLQSQLREGTSVLPTVLRAVSPGTGDVRDARDTSIELRATIATAVACDTVPGGIVLPPAASMTPGSYYAGIATPISVGDTVWILSPPGAGDSWIPYAIQATGSAPPGQCAAVGPHLSDVARATARTSVILTSPLPTEAIGTPLRITRPIRFSVYRASDGGWYLGGRDWNAATLRFNTVQPVAGPFLSAGAGGVVFSYMDRHGAVLASPVADPHAIAIVRVDFRGQTRAAVQILRAAGPSVARVDSLSVMVALRGG